MALKLNPCLSGTFEVDDSNLNLLITGGTTDTRALVQDIVFNALEGAGFRNLDYVVGGLAEEPTPDVQSLLDAMKDQNPHLFETRISIENHPRAWEVNSVVQLHPSDVQTSQITKLSGVEMEIEGKVRIKL